METDVLCAGLRMRGIFKSVRFRVFQQLAHRVTHRIQHFWLLTRSRYAFSKLPALFLLGRMKIRQKERKKERKKEGKEERQKERQRKDKRTEKRRERRMKKKGLERKVKIKSENIER